MNAIADLLTQLQNLDIRVTVDDDRLRLNAPQGALTADLRAKLVAHKSEILAYLRASDATQIMPVSRAQPLPLSFAQQRLWILDQLDGASALYNIPLAWRLHGSLEVNILARALREIFQRHEILRTRITVANETPTQVSIPAVTVPFQVLRLANASEADIARVITAQAQQPFDLRTSELVRVTLVELSATEHVLILVMHHIVSDGWSLGIFFAELSALYRAFALEQPAPLSALPIQYADWAMWQREWLQGETLAKQLAYWKTQLADAPTTLELPTDRPRPAIQTSHGRTFHFEIAPDLTRQLAIQSQQNGATLYMTLLAAFATLLMRHTHQRDLVIGTPIANRNRPETEALIGLFVNTLPLRIDLTGDPSFRDLVRRVRELALNAYDHQDVPFEKLVDTFQPERHLRYSPLFQVMFAMQNTPRSLVELPGIQVHPLDVETDTAKFDLTLFVTEPEQGLDCALEYNTDLFDVATIQRLANHYCILLTSVVAAPEQSLADLPLLTINEREQLLNEWNDTAANYANVPLVHQAFEAHVALTPDAPALVFGETRLTYRELNQRANQLAVYLLRQGVAGDSLVGICMERSAEMIIALLGIFKAGSAYVPLDPAFPNERLAYIVQDTRLAILFTQKSLVKKCVGLGVQTICLDDQTNGLAAESIENPNVGVAPGNLAYVIFTSGSTGKPKGVAVEHHQLRNYTQSVIERFNLSTGWSYAHVSTFAADLGNTMLFPSLCTGGALHILAYEQTTDPDALAQYMHTHPIDCLKITPSHFTVLLSARRPERIVPHRRLIFGGEPLPWDLVKRIQVLNPDCAIFNHYGPTETTVGAISGRAECASKNEAGIVPLGRPLANVQLYVLDAQQQLVPIGVTGELYIGGAGVTRGYLYRPDLTAEKFVPNPFGRGGRLYRTGDMVRYRADGKIEFLGRMDRQVKWHGFRIELDEIEHVLGRYPNVHQSVVLLQPNGVGDLRLVAYVATGTTWVDVNELRNWAKTQLPDYMIPLVFVQLKTLPLTPNGKIDYRALPLPEAHPIEPSAFFVAPRTPIEQTLAQIWSEVLGIAQISVQDNFFELGGDSILSIQIVARANQAGLRLAPRQIFQHQTIAELATVVRVAPVSQAQQTPVVGTVPLTPIQHRLFEQSLSAPHHWNQSFILQTREPLQPELVREVVRHLLAHHDALRLRLHRLAATWVQFNAPTDDHVPFDYYDLGEQSLVEQKQTMESTATQLQTSLNLSAGPLMRVALFDCGVRQANRLLIVVHHLAIDGVSWRILLDDLQTAYHQLSRGEAVRLPAKTVSFKQWAERLNAHAQSPAIEQQIAYWLSVENVVPALPLDYPDGLRLNTHGSSETVSVMLSTEETQALLHRVPATYNTQINEALLTALAQAFAEWTGSSNLRIDLEGHGREDLFADLDVSRTVGWFTSVFPLTLSLRDTQPSQAIRDIQEQLNRVPQRGIGFGLLRYLNRNRELAEKFCALPQSQISFNYLGQYAQAFGQDSLFALAPESAGAELDPQAPRRYVLSVSGWITAGRLELTWFYSKQVHRRETIAQLAQQYVKALRDLIATAQTIPMPARALMPDRPSPLVAIQPQGSLPPFFCVHPISGNILAYFELASHLGRKQPVYALRAIGLEEDDAPLDTIPDLAERYMRAIETVQVQGPYYLGGWSLGGMIAYEMAQRWIQRGKPVALVAMFDTKASHLVKRDRGASLIAEFLQHLGLPPEYLTFTQEVEPEKRLECIQSAINQFGLLPSGADPVQVERLWRVFQANVRASMTYGPPSTVRVPAYLFRADTNDAALPTLGWENLTAVYPVSGHHLTLFKSPNIQSLAVALQTCLALVRKKVDESK